MSHWKFCSFYDISKENKTQFHIGHAVFLEKIAPVSFGISIEKSWNWSPIILFSPWTEMIKTIDWWRRRRRNKRKKKVFKIYDHRCRTASQSFFFFFFFLKLLKRHIHLLISLYFRSGVSTWHSTGLSVCVVRSVTVGFFGRGFMSFGVCVCVCVTTVLFLGSFWETFFFLSTLPPPSIYFFPDTHDNIQVVKMSLPHVEREKNPSEECFKSYRRGDTRRNQIFLDSASNKGIHHTHQKGPFSNQNFYWFSFSSLRGPPFIFYCSVSSGGPVVFKGEVYTRKVYFFCSEG